MSAPETPPRRVGRYDLYGAIASGGMATVHFARLRGAVGFGRTVAVKRVHRRHAADADVLAMLVDEARLAARIEHPNVLAAFDVITEGQEIFLIMDYVRGESLARLIRAGRDAAVRIPPSIASSIAGGVLAGLHEAHEARNERGEPLAIVHRDVSPQNVIVGVDGVARVLDFGIAKAAQRVQKATLTGQIKGKINYLAPEQIAGQPIDRRTDVWALSVVLWETLTGERLFSAPEPAAILHRIAKGIVSPPSEHVSGLPAALDEVVLKGLCTRPDERFQTASEMAQALERAMPPATAREVGELVQRLAADALSERAATVATIERAAADLADQPEARSERSPAPAAAAPPRQRAPAASAAAGHVDDPRTELTNVSTIGGARARGPRLLAALTVAAIGVAAAVGLVMRPKADPARLLATSGVERAAEWAPPAPPEPSMEHGGSSPSTPPAAAAPEATATASAAASATTGHPPSKATTRPVASAAPAAPAAADCATPYSYERVGDQVIKRWKPGCVNR